MSSPPSRGVIKDRLVFGLHAQNAKDLRAAGVLAACCSREKLACRARGACGLVKGGREPRQRVEVFRHVLTNNACAGFSR
jgi:hypothetical protein